jgi:hypothetical protein
MAYKYHVSQTKVICVSSFAKKPVRGIAKCDTNFDAFDVETGKKLARLRCDVKVSEKRKNRANLKLAEAQEAYEAAKARLEKMQNYVADATVEYANAQKELADFEETL